MTMNILASAPTLSRAWKCLPSSRSVLASLLLGLLLPLFAGCSSPAAPGTPAQEESTPAKNTKAIVTPSPFDDLKKGMTADQVRKLVGEPEQIKPFQAGGLNSGVWVYHRVITQQARPVIVGTREVPTVDPLNGRAGVSRESVMGTEFLTLSGSIEILMIEQQLIELKRIPKVDRTIN